MTPTYCTVTVSAGFAAGPVPGMMSVVCSCVGSEPVFTRTLGRSLRSFAFATVILIGPASVGLIVAAGVPAGGGSGANWLLPHAERARTPATARARAAGRDARGIHILAISLSTRSSTDRNGSLHSTVRWAWSL